MFYRRALRNSLICGNREHIFVVLTLTAYLDESGTHGDSAVTIRGGILANARQWQRFDAEFSRLKKKHNFRVFHTKKFKRRAGDFKGWTVDQQFALINDLVPISASGFTEGVTVTIDNAEYEANYRTGEKPKRLRLESRYGLCFRNSLIFFILEGLKRVYRGEPPKMHFVLESGHRNWNEARDIFNETKQELQGHGCNMLGEITFADKDECDPLMMADFLAHTTFMMHARMPTPGTPIAPTVPIGRKESGVTHLTFKPGGLAELRETLIAKLKPKRQSAL
jgi:hypothetical protein